MFLIGKIAIANQSNNPDILDTKGRESIGTIQGATSVPLLTVDTVVSVTGSDSPASNGNKSTATTTIPTGQCFRKIHKSGGDDEGDGVKGVTFQKTPYFRQASRRSLQLIRGPSRYIH